MSSKKLHEYEADTIFSELRSACAHKDFDKAHHCIRWFLLHGNAENMESALHYAINTVRLDMSNSYRWPWWLAFVRNGKRASINENKNEFFRILPPEAEVLFR